MSEGKNRILVAEDEPRYARAIQFNLQASGYEALICSDGQTAVDLVVEREPDLIILDVRMPALNGFDACRRIREFSTVPIIMLTAMAEEADKVRGLDCGADDYVTKPFGAEELLARVRAVLRRAGPAAQDACSKPFQVGDMVVDLSNRQVSVGGREVRLTATEYRLLCELIQQRGRVLVPDYLLETVWGVGYNGETSLVWQAVHRLRQKIETDPRNPRYIHTRPGVGYLFSDADEPTEDTERTNLPQV